MTRIEHPEDATVAAPRRWPREVLRVLAGAVLVVAIAILLRRHFGTVEEWLASLGFWAPLAFVGVHVLVVPCFFPVSVLGFLAGATFGFWRGTAVLFVGGMLAATVMFVLARTVASARVRAYAGSRPRLARFLELAEDDAVRLMILLRLSPLHFSLVSYLLGASRVRLLPYLATSAFVLPSAALQAYVGRTAREVGRRSLGDAGASPWETVAAVAAIAAAVVLTILLGRLARRALESGPAADEDRGTA